MSDKLQFGVSGFGSGRAPGKFGRGSTATYKGGSYRVIDRKWTGSIYLYAITNQGNVNELPDEVITGVKEEELA